MWRTAALRVAHAAALAITLAPGCAERKSAAPAPAPAPAPVTVAATAADAAAPAWPPPLPDGIKLQLSIARTGEIYRVATDGRYLVTVGGKGEVQQPPTSRTSPGAQVISPAGLERLGEALTAAKFFDLPATLPDTSACVPPGVVMPNSGRPVTLEPVSIAARSGDRVRAAQVAADLAADCTLGALQQIYRPLDEEALGNWMNE